MVGQVSKYQVPLFMTFDEKEVEYIASTLADSLERAYAVIDMFQLSDEDYDDDDNL